MKRKVYVKQMKLLKGKAKRAEPKQNISEETGDLSNVSLPIQESSNILEASSSNTVASSSPYQFTRSAVSTAKWGPLPPSTISNSGPLPKVDVLMKNSSLRAFQLRQTQNLVQSSSQDFGEDENNIHILNPEAPPVTYVGSQANHEKGNNMDNWAKDSPVVGNTNVSPIPSHSPYRVDYSSSYNVNLEQVDNPVNDNSQPSSPVFHQLQASRIGVTNVQPDTGMQVNGFSADRKIPNEHHHSPRDMQPYNLHVAGPREIQQNQASDYIRYHNHDSTTQHLQDDSLHGHDQVSSWEQENYRYMDLSWRDDQKSESRESAYSSSVDEENEFDHQNTDVNGSVLNGSIDLSNKPTRSASKSGSGRRRRKRVQTPVQRSAANMRERRRMSHLNVAFEYLKEHLPNVKDKKKLSRIQTLKAAIYYIHLLQDSLNVH